MEERWSIYHFWKNTLQRECSNTLFSELNSYQENEKSLREVYQMASAVSIARKEIEVIGATSCAAAKHRVLIENLKPKLIIIEEAAELLESHIVVSLAKSTTSMILIGDHCQLAPSPASLLCHMKVSLFQRLIDEGLEPLVLDEQFRMRPEISKLVSLLSYPFLVDGSNVRKYPHIHGMKYNMFFLNISHKEEMTASASFSNNGEIERVVQICSFLVEQGYDPKRITVLSPYNGQVRLINSILHRLECTAEVNAVAVDGYQGEENDIIVLSLVRSNVEGRIGFLSDKRRLTVAFSRAKLGLFVIGDVATLRRSKDPSWDLILNYLEENCLTGPDVPLWCQAHSHGKYLNDYNTTDGFCSHPCPSKLPCGHPCLYKCHGGDEDHKRNFRCSSRCEKVCTAGHQCASLCGDKCLCEVKVEKKLPCGHIVIMPCGRTPSQEHCEAQCSVTLKCGHMTQVMCRTLDGKHHDPDCFEVCGKLNEACLHTCQKRCCEDCNPCVELVYTTLSCGHTVQKPCGTEASKVICLATCQKKLPCGHVCSLSCANDCLCSNVVKKRLCDFGHTAEMLCYEPVMPCKAPCVKTFDDCGHKCKKLCSEDCLCVELVPAVIPCGHSCDVPCHIVKNMDKHDDFEVGKWCTNPCGQELPCSHLCTGECGSCIQEILHQKCEAHCTEILLCGHTCTALCSDLVHVCKEARCLNESPTVFVDKLQPKGKARRMRTLFDITREINGILQDKQKSRTPNNKTITSKRSLIPKIKQKLTSFVIGPLYEKIIRIPNSMLEKNTLAHGFISNLMTDIRDVWMSRVPTARFLKNLIFKMEFSVLLIRYHQDLENRAPSEPAMNLTLLARILKIAESQEYTFSWDQILRLVELVRHEGPLQFQYTLQYAKPLSDHQSDQNPQTWIHWID
uniref:NFX1-type zinc finger-containing protein 1 n=1 Tax=Lygus hesperus TaxID=30085 RepID=A0A146KT43_LYGHE